MFLFNSKPNTILLFTRDSLICYSTTLQQPTKITFPKEIVYFGTIKDVQKFESLASEFLKSLGKKLKCILLLSSDIVFSKKVMPNNSEDFKNQANSFIDKVPIESGKVHYIALHINKEVFLFATDKQIVESLISVCKSNSWQLDHVLPINTLSIDPSKMPPVKEVVSTCQTSLKSYPSLDFLKAGE